MTFLPPRSRLLFTLCAFLVTGILSTTGCSKPAGSKAKLAAVTEGDSEFAVPEGDPDAIVEFIKQLGERVAQRQDAEETVKTWQALVSAGDQLLAQKSAQTRRISDEALREGTEAKITGTLLPLMHPIDESTVSDTAINDAIKTIDELRHDKRPAVAATAEGYWILARTMSLKSSSEKEKQDLAEEVLKRADAAKLAPEAIRDVTIVADDLAREGDLELALNLMDRLAQTMSESSDTRVSANASRIRSQVKRMRLIGKEIDLTGTLMGGGELDWASYRGKVVLVDFWATWCGPCVGELPNVKSNYQQYHDKGFEVIGISLDNERRDLERFVKREALPWAQVFDDRNKAAMGWNNPLAHKYGVSSIPAAFLVDKDGKVVSLQARGPELGRLLKKML